MNHLMKPFLTSVLLALATAHAEEPRVIRLDATSPGRVFEGVGAVSAGASTRLLPDYPEKQRRRCSIISSNRNLAQDSSI